MLHHRTKDVDQRAWDAAERLAKQEAQDASEWCRIFDQNFLAGAHELRLKNLARAGHVVIVAPTPPEPIPNPAS